MYLCLYRKISLTVWLSFSAKLFSWYFFYWKFIFRKSTTTLIKEIMPRNFPFNFFDTEKWMLEFPTNWLNALMDIINGAAWLGNEKFFFSFNERYIKKTFLKVKKSTYQEFFNLVDFTKSHVLIIFTCVYSYF